MASTSRISTLASTSVDVAPLVDGRSSRISLGEHTALAIGFVLLRDCAGCCLHIVTDDDSFDDDFVNVALHLSTVAEHRDCLTAAQLLSMCTLEERAEAVRSVWEQVWSRVAIT